jgi:hypothetical protein
MVADLAALKALQFLLVTPNAADVRNAIDVRTIKEEGVHARA